jgi:hypothetical protein
MNRSPQTHTPRPPSFETLEREVDGVVANARVSFSLATIGRAVDHAEWTRALGALESLASTLEPLELPEGAWREVLVAAGWFGVHADDISPVAAPFELYATRAWSNSQPQAMPWQLSVAFSEADRLERFDTGRALGELVAQLFSSCTLGAYAAAHFGERGLAGRADEAVSIAERFEKAGELAETIEMQQTAARCRLRAGTLLLRTSASRNKGRTLLRSVDPSDFGRTDALWYAVGMAHSPFWLDRVRAADAVLAQAESTDSELDTPEALACAIDYLLDCAPFDLHSLEVDRLEALIDTVLDDDSASDNATPTEDARRARRRLELRSHLEGAATSPVWRAGEAADTLSSHADEESPRQRAAVEFARAVGQIYAGDEALGLDSDSLARLEEAFPVAAAVLQALVPAVREDPRRLATAMGELEGLFRQHGAAVSQTLAKPAALLWPKLLPLVHSLRAKADEDTDDVDRTTARRIVASTREVLTRWIPIAPSPSYGWWSLAANLLGDDFADAARLATRRAVEDGEQVDDALERRVLAAVLDRTVRDGDPEQMLAWLEVAERRYSE